MNPCSEAACAQDTLERINVINKDMINAALKGSAIGVKDSVWKLSSISNHIKACHAQNPARKIWIDFDIDCLDLDEAGIDIIKKTTLKYFKQEDVALIKTAGGVHVLVKHNALKFNPNIYCKEIEDALNKYDVPEVKKNDNCMVPTPGCYQYGNVVRVIRWTK